jgi:cytoskeletal protein RodZ
MALKNGFVKKSVETLTLGEKLKKLRSERRISLSEVSRFTKIQVKYLEYLEEGNYGKLPADVYAKGFLRNYAEFLGVDENVLIKLYEKEKGIQRNIEEKKHKINYRDLKPKPIKISSFVLTPRLAIITLIVILVLVGVFYLYREVGSFAEAPKLVILSPENNYNASGNSVTVEGTTDPDVKIYINDQLILVNDEGKFRENLTLQSGTNMINIKAVNRFNKEAAETLTVQSNYQEDEASTTSSEEKKDISAQQKSIKIEIRVDPGPVWISVETDGGLVFSGTMLSGATQTFEAEAKITVNSGQANATFIKFNGKDIGALGDKPEAVRGVTFTPDTKY